MTSLLTLAAAAVHIAVAVDGADVKAVRPDEECVEVFISHTNSVDTMVSFDMEGVGMEGYWLARDPVIGFDEGQYSRYYAAVVPPGHTNIVRFLPRNGAVFSPGKCDSAGWNAWMVEKRNSKREEDECEHCASRKRGW